jgi:hypothetical protein
LLEPPPETSATCDSRHLLGTHLDTFVVLSSRHHMPRPWASLVISAGCAVVSCAPPARDAQTKPGVESSYLLVSAGDADGAASDFLAVIDLRSESPDLGKAIATMPTGMKNSMPHHMEYAMPPAGEFLFMNAHHHEMSMLLDVSNPRALRAVKPFAPPPPLRFPHDYSRTPDATRLVGFLRSEGKSIDPEETVTPGNHGGIAEYSADGILLRHTMAGNAGGKPVRPYAFALLPELDRLVVTSAPMMEIVSADVLQIYRYSDLTLLHTIDLPAGRLLDGRQVDGSQRAGFGPRVLSDGSVFLNSYGCTFYGLSEIGSNHPRLETFLLWTRRHRQRSQARFVVRAAFRWFSDTTGSIRWDNCTPSWCWTSPTPQDRAKCSASKRPIPSTPIGSPAIRSPTVSCSAPSWEGKRASTSCASTSRRGGCLSIPHSKARAGPAT